MKHVRSVLYEVSKEELDTVLIMKGRSLQYL